MSRASEPYPIYVVGQKSDGTYATFHTFAVDGEGIEHAERECERRGMRYVTCSRPRKSTGDGQVSRYRVVPDGEGYYTVVVPWVPHAWRTEWHPTEDVGPLSTITRGAFATIGDAIEWGRENLNGCPYYIRLIPGVTGEGE